MINLAAAGILVRDLTSRHLEGATHGPPSRTPAPPAAAVQAAGEPIAQPGWIRRVASLVTQRGTEETWPRRKSRTSAC
jgi:hypothetical protein